MNKKKLLKTLGVVSLIGAIGIGSTFAYLTSSTGPVTNTFTVGNVDFDDDMDNGIMESKVTRDRVGDDDSNNYKDADEDKRTSTGNKYTDLVAGEVVFKDPTVYMGKDSVDAWLFVRVYNAEYTYEDGRKAFASVDIDNDKWVEVVSDEDEDGTYVDYAYKSPVVAGKDYTVFTYVTMGELKAGDKIPEITIKACAVQAAGFDTAEEAYVESVWGE